MRLGAATKAFRGPRFQALHRRWLEVGDPALWLAQSPTFLDALERGEGRIECLELPHSYMNLSSLIGTAQLKMVIIIPTLCTGGLGGRSESAN